jgi:transposase
MRFLRRLDHATPAGLDLHLILDKLHAAHETQAIKRWLVRHPRFHLHFAPTSASWANAIEGFFAQLTTTRLRRGAFHSSLELHNAIDTSLAWHNANPSVRLDQASPHHPRQGQPDKASVGVSTLALVGTQFIAGSTVDSIHRDSTRLPHTANIRKSIPASRRVAIAG